MHMSRHFCLSMVLAATAGPATAQVVTQTVDKGVHSHFQYSVDSRAFLKSILPRIGPRGFVFDATSAKSGTLEITNPGDSAISATVTVDFVARTVGPKVAPTDAAAPVGAESRSLVGWLRGVPTTVTLKPHETQTFPLTLAVPEHLADGEYRARITVVNPVHPLVTILFTSTDNLIAAQILHIAPGTTRRLYFPGMLSDQIEVVYRQGTPSAGIELSNPRVARLAGDSVKGCVRARATGSVPPRGYAHVTVAGAGTNAVSQVGWLALYDDRDLCYGVVAPKLAPGQYVFGLRIDTDPGDYYTAPEYGITFPPLPGMLVPFPPAEVEIPFEVRP